MIKTFLVFINLLTQNGAGIYTNSVNLFKPHMFMKYLLMSAFAVILCCSCHHRKNANNSPGLAVNDQKLCVAEVPNTDDEQLGYVLYHTEHSGGVDTYCVVTKSLHNDTDDYKRFCKTIIADIAENADFNACEIRIYDSNEAFRLNENLLYAGHWLLTADEERTVQQHLVASYWHHVYRDEEDDNTISYYQYLPDFHAGTEVFVPENGKNS